MARLLGLSDPPPVHVVEGDTQTPLMVLCEHASNAVPLSLRAFGVDARDMVRHIAWDVGARAVAERIATSVGGCGVFSGYSRLVVDCNRPLWSKTLIPEVSDGTDIPANRGLSWQAIAQRVEEIYLPYHLAVAEARGRFAARGVRPLVLFVHSFTPQMDDVARPWSIGAPHSVDDSVSRPFIEILRGVGGFEVGDDEPYGFGDYSDDYSVVEHAISKGLKHLFLEIRQDEIADEAGVILWSDRILSTLKTLKLI